MFSAGEHVTAARLTHGVDSVELSSTEQSTTSVVDFGTETITFPNPEVAVKVSAVLTCAATRTVSPESDATVRVAISLDGGATFENGNQPRAAVGTGDWRAIRLPLHALNFRQGTPTGDIVVKAQCQNQSEPDNTLYFQGALWAEMRAA